VSDLGERAAIIPGRDPELRVRLRRIPVSEVDLEHGIIPVCEPTLKGNEARYLMECLESNWISSAGKFIPKFEQAFAAKCGCDYGVAVANGTVAVHLALATLGIGPGDEVILPTFTMIATINAVTYTGATPVLVDSELETWNLDVEQVAARITPRTRAILLVHTYGHPVCMQPLCQLANQHDLTIVDDAAEAHGAQYKQQPVGALGHCASFSFYANKIITTGEGGMITTNDERIAKLARNLRDHAFSDERHFWHKYVGYNYRMTNMQAAVGLAQVEQMDDFIANRRRNAARYSRRLRKLPGLTTPPEADWATNVFWMYGLLVDAQKFGMNRDQLRAYLADRGIETRTFFIPMHLQPIYYERFGHERHPNAEHLCQTGFYLPSASSLTDDQIDYIVGVVEEAHERARGD
ncbi:MAG TPA: DegT/DnrJ/EryC1/StrS family aminotransferase, partial [Ardenticatenaceae bacterium]|nr:DegT/DnrJ/EryC1/StrS family aminotransferase [Ardenticatenaceae bacterium]